MFPYACSRQLYAWPQPVNSVLSGTKLPATGWNTPPGAPAATWIPGPDPPNATRNAIVGTATSGITRRNGRRRLLRFREFGGCTLVSFSIVGAVSAFTDHSKRQIVQADRPGAC